MAPLLPASMSTPVLWETPVTVVELSLRLTLPP